MTWPSLTTQLLSSGLLLLSARLLMSAVGVSVFYWRQSVSDEPKTFRGFMRFCVPREIFTHPCVQIDISLVILRKLVGFWGVVPVGAMIAVLAPLTYSAAGLIFGVHAQHPASIWVSLFIILILMLVHDFAEWFCHAASHNVRYLWEFHKVHHSVQFMTPISAKRAHFVDDLVRMGVIGPGLGVSVGLLSYLFGLAPMESSLLGVDAYVIGNILDFDQLRHSHVPLTYGRAEAFLMSPSQHQLHHNREGKPRNFGSFLSVWDRLFGSFEYSRPPGSFKIGLPPAEQSNYNSVLKLYVRPFYNVGVILHKKWVRRQNARRNDKGGTPPIDAPSDLPALG
jgi:sterol desaturase/sphingolipid hydroxylase (fatty acid hydroxylase superfamily)